MMKIISRIIEQYSKYFQTYTVYMINICTYCNPNYSSEKRINTNDNRYYDFVTQLILLYKSIQKNWTNFDYTFTVFYNKNIEWSKEDKKRVSELKDLNIIGIDKPDHPDLPWQTRLPGFVYPLKQTGTYRLVIDCDMLAVNNPTFDMECDWQCIFADSCYIPEKYLQFIINKYNFKSISNDLDKKDLCKKYFKCQFDYKKLYPYFNVGAILMKEELCQEFVDLVRPCYELAFNSGWQEMLEKENTNEIAESIRHIVLQYCYSFALLTISDNWKPFQPGFNYCCKFYPDMEEFGLEKISLIHFAGLINFEEDNKLLKKVETLFPEEFSSTL